MATEDLNISMDTFSIQDTQTIGNADFLEGLLSPETVSTKPEEVKPIVQEVEDTTIEKQEVKKTVKEIDPDLKNKGNLIDSFLETSNDDEEDDDDELIIKKPSSSEEDDANLNVESNKFKALANDLFNLGVFTKEDENETIEISSPEDFLERFQIEKKKGAMEFVDNFIGQFGEDYKNAFEAIYVKGVDPREYFGVYNSIVNFAELDLTKEENQVLVVRKSLSDQGFEEEDIDAEIERLKSYGDIEQVAQRNHKVLVKKDAARLEEMERKAERENQQKIMLKNQYINNVQSLLSEKLKTKEFDGIPLNPKLADELQDFLLVDKWKTNSGETLTDFDRTILDLKRPENHATKVKVALILKILEKDPTLSTIQKVGVTKKSNQIFSETIKQTSGTKTNENKTSVGRWFQ